MDMIVSIFSAKNTEAKRVCNWVKDMADKCRIKLQDSSSKLILF